MTRIAIVVRFLVAVALAPLLLDSIFDRAVRAAIVVTGDTNLAYDNSDPWATSELIVGDTAPASMTIDNGSVVNNTYSSWIANSSNASTSSVLVTGAGSSWTSGDIYVGYFGTGTLTITDGGSVSNDVFGIIAAGAGSNGTVTVGGGTGTSSWISGGPISVGSGGPGTLNINSGGFVSARGIGGGFQGMTPGGFQSSEIRFDGGTLRIRETNQAPNLIHLLPGGGTIDIPDTATNVTLTGVISGSGILTKTGAGTLALLGFNTYVGGTTVSAGTLSIGGSNFGNIANDSIVQFGSGLTYAGVISGNGAVIQETSGTVNLTGNNTYTGTTTINHGTLRIGTGGTSGSIAGEIINNSHLRFDRSDSVTYGAISGDGDVIKQGAGTLALTGANTYTGTTTIDAGTLSIGNGGTTGSIASASIVNDASLIFDRSDAVTYAGVISGEGAVIKKGAGTLTLTSANTYDGTTTISAGALSIGNGGTTGSIIGATVTNNASLIFNRSNSMTFARIIGGTGSVTKLGSGILTLTRANTYQGGTTVSAGTLLAANDSGSATGSGDVSVDSGATLAIGSGSNFGSVAGNITNNGAVQFNRFGTLTYNKQISGSGTVAKQGNGTLTLSSPNTYSGDTTVSAGTLLANNTTGSATGSGNVTVASGATLGGTGALAGNVSVNGMLSPGASIESLGTGSLNFNSGSTFNYEVSSGQLTADLVNATGGLSISTAGSGVRFALTQLGQGVILPIGTKFTVISYEGTWDGGTFLGIPDLGKASIGFNLYQMRYQDTTPGLNFANETSLNTTGHFVTLTTIAPEPGFITLAMIGCCAMAVVHPRKRFGFNAAWKQGKEIA